MASGTRLLLRLPPCLRQQVLAQVSFTKGGVSSHELFRLRSFRTSASSGKAVQRTKASPSKLAPKASTSSRLSPNAASTTSPPTVASPPISRISANRAFIDTYQPLSEKILLYASPDHTSFFTASYLIGGFLLVGAYSYAEMFLKDRPGLQTSWLLKSVSAFSTICVAAFGCTFVLAPSKMIKSISIVSSKTSEKLSSHGPRVLRFEIKRALPFLKPDVLEASPKKISLDRNVPLAIQDLHFVNIPTVEAQSFTERYFAPTKPTNNSQQGTFTSFNRSLLNAWPTVKRETRRMFLRDQMAYVGVDGNGTFKLDLQNCSMLDGGDPLYRIAAADSNARPNVGRWFRRLFSG